MAIYKIPVVYQSWGTVDVEADDLDEALKFAKENVETLPLPLDPQYIDGSYEIDEDSDMLSLNK